MARSVYNDADIYILDDPLSAVDAHVAKHIFFECINKLLKEKAVLLITNQLNFLHLATRVAVIENSTIPMYNSYDALMKLENVDFVERVLKQHSLKSSEADHEKEKLEHAQEDQEKIDSIPIIDSTKEEDKTKSDIALFKEQQTKQAAKTETHKLIQDESRSKGAVGIKVYLYYFYI